MINCIKSILKFFLNPIIDDWNGGISLVRLTFIAIMYATYTNILANKGIDWSTLVIILFILIYMCFKGDAAVLIGKLLDNVGNLKSSVASKMTEIKKANSTSASDSDSEDKS